MTDSNIPRLDITSDGAEPERDHELAALLRDVVSPAPEHAVEWQQLAQRIMRAVALQRPAPWWSYAQRWERRVIPIALAAGMLGAVALYSLGAPSATTTNADLLTAVVDGTPVTDATASYANLVAGSEEPVVGVPE